MRSNSLALIAVLGVAAALRALRMHVRWDEITLAYAAYAEPLTTAMADGHPTALIGHWIGLHPPLWGVIHAAFELVAPLPWAWMGFSAACSVGAVWVVGRHAGWVAALVLATAPVHLLDGAEVNNYPMAALAMALLIATARGPWLGLAAAAVFAAWAHLLTSAAGAVVVWRSLSVRSHRNRLWAPSPSGCFRLSAVRCDSWARAAHGPSRMYPSRRGWLQGATIGPEAWCSRSGRARFAGDRVLGRSSARLLGRTDAAAAHQRPYLGIVALQPRSPSAGCWATPMADGGGAVVCLVRGAHWRGGCTA